MKKETLTKTQRGLTKIPPMKKEAPKNAKGLNRNTFDEKRCTPKNVKGLNKKTSDKKEASQKYKGA
jgi:hypothetical protein